MPIEPLDDLDQHPDLQDLANRPGPWTEEEFLALRRMPAIVELVDGALLVNFRPAVPHQRLAARLMRALEDAAPDRFEVLPEIDVRLRTGRILVPDLTVIHRPGAEDGVLPVADVTMVCEISSPSNAATDHILKLHLYAQAGIPHYLLIDREADGPHAVAFTLDRCGTYRPAAKAEPGQTLVLTEPFAFTIDLGGLARATRPPRG